MSVNMKHGHEKEMTQLQIDLPSLAIAVSASNLCSKTLTSSSSWFQYRFTIIRTSSSV